MTKQHIPQFSGGRGKPPGRGASLQCRPARCHADTVCSYSLIPQLSGPQPHLLNWSTLHISSAGFSKKQYFSGQQLGAKSTFNKSKTVYYKLHTFYSQPRRFVLFCLLFLGGGGNSNQSLYFDHNFSDSILIK